MMSLSQRSGCLTGFAAALALVTGCASPGPPRAPSLHLPNRVTNLVAERHGNDVVVRFQTPEKTTDNETLTAPVTASLCRAVADGSCRATNSFPVKIGIAGPVEWADVLPPELTTGTASRIAYRVEVFNQNGRSAGPSEPAFVAAGEAPHKVEGLRAEGSRDGIVLRWTTAGSPSSEVLLKREALDGKGAAKPAVAATKPVVVPKTVGGRKGRVAPAKPGADSAEDANIVWLHGAAGSAGDRGGIVDATASVDEQYRYTAARSRTVTLDGHKLEMRGDASEAVTITLRDVYPPAVPQGLLAAGFPVQGANSIAVDLVWRPNTESDLAGYNVYRQLAPEGSRVKLNEKPVPLPAFHDATAARGVGYRYTVTAVDAKGNESAASEPEEMAAIP